jgi:hypothetical protein
MLYEWKWIEIAVMIFFDLSMQQQKLKGSMSKENSHLNTLDATVQIDPQSIQNASIAISLPLCQWYRINLTHRVILRTYLMGSGDVGNTAQRHPPISCWIE